MTNTATAPQAATLTIHGFYERTPNGDGTHADHLDRPSHAELRSTPLATEAAAKEYAASLPKALGLKVAEHRNPNGSTWVLSAWAGLQPTAGNPINEAGVRRVKAWAKAGAGYEPQRLCSNTYATLEALLDGIEAQATTNA